MTNTPLQANIRSFTKEDNGRQKTITNTYFTMSDVVYELMTVSSSDATAIALKYNISTPITSDPLTTDSSNAISFTIGKSTTQNDRPFTELLPEIMACILPKREKDSNGKFIMTERPEPVPIPSDRLAVMKELGRLCYREVPEFVNLFLGMNRDVMKVDFNWMANFILMTMKDDVVNMSDSFDYTMEDVLRFCLLCDFAAWKDINNQYRMTSLRAAKKFFTLLDTVEKKAELAEKLLRPKHYMIPSISTEGQTTDSLVLLNATATGYNYVPIRRMIFKVMSPRVQLTQADSFGLF